MQRYEKYLLHANFACKNSMKKNSPESFVTADETEYGFGNKIPLWIFGFLC